MQSLLSLGHGGVATLCKNVGVTGNPLKSFAVDLRSCEFTRRLTANLQLHAQAVSSLSF